MGRMRQLSLCSSRGDDCLDVDDSGVADAQRSVSRYVLKGYGERRKRFLKGYLEVSICATC